MEESSQKKEMLLEFLQCAARGETEEIITSLTCHPHLIHAQHSESGDTALIMATRENQTEVIAVLLEHGADVTLHNSNSQTALHVAIHDIRAQLLSAVKRTSFPQLSLAQAAWQGDLDTIRDLLSTDCCQDVNTLNAQGLTPLMLAVCDVDLFEGMSMEREYKPVSVLEELIKRHGNTHLLDLNGNSAMSYASQVQSPLRQQLMDALEKSPPPPEILDGDFCGFCPDTKPILSDTAASTPDRDDSQSTHSGNEQACDVVAVGDRRQEAKAEVRICPEADVAGGASLCDLDKNNTMDERKKNSLSAQWLPDLTPQHLTSRPSIKKHPSLPPLHMKKAEKDVQLERRGFGYLFQGSRSDSNIPEAQLEVDPLRNIRYIKEHISRRLRSGETAGNSRTFPPVCYSPHSPKFYRLKPLPKFSSRKSKTDGSIILNSEELYAKSTDDSLCGHDSVQKPGEGLDVVLSKDQVQISLVSVTNSESTNQMGDKSPRSAHSSISIGSGRREDKEASMNHDNTSLPQICSRIPELHPTDKTPRSSWSKGTHFSLERETSAVQKNHETVKDKPSDHKNNEFVTNGDINWLKHETDLLHSSRTSKNTENDHIEMPLDNRLLHMNKVIESIKMNSPSTPRATYVPFVQITFSEQEANTEVHHPLAKQFLAKRKPNLSILTNISKSFNINAQKENEKSKKNKIRNMSAPNLKYPRPLSNSNGNCRKCVPLPTLVYSSEPSPSKLSNKPGLKSGSAERKSHRSQTQLSIYTKKRLSSPVIPAMTPRSQTAHDYHNIPYSDMFVEIKPQNNGPGIFQMFETPVYINGSKEDARGRKQTSSASSTSCSSKGVRLGSSRESSARSFKRGKPKNKKKSSATHGQRKNSLTKSVAAKDISENTKDNMVIISGTNWEIKTIKQEGSVSEGVTSNLHNSISHLTQPEYSDLSIIKEATIENSLTGNEAAQTTFIMKFQEVGQASHTENLKKENVEPVDAVERNGIENRSSERDEDQRREIFNTGDLGQPRHKTNAEERPSEEVQLLQEEATLINLNSREQSVKNILIEDSEKDKSHEVYCVSIPMKSTPNSATSDMLISFERCLKQIDEQSNDSKIVANHQDNDQSANIHRKQHTDESGRENNLIQINRCTSPKIPNAKNSNQSGNYFVLSNNDSSIHWIKGEVLGRGAYGTVYRGLTSQGELIAAKQVMLHGSNPAVAEKEYKKLQEEVDLLKTLKHDNIVGYLGTCLEDNIVTIFMEFVPGGSIANILRHFGPLQEVVINKYTIHILQGTAYLHKNRVVHRDIKGNNVMLMPNGVIKLIDFGCAKRLNGLNMNGTRREMLKSMHGTPYWMAPEVISESGHGEKSDIWSIGCTVFEMATGKPPLANMNKMAAMFYIAAQKGLMPTLPDQFSKKARDFVNLCLIREQEERPSAEQLLQHPFTREKNSPQRFLQEQEED